MMEITTRRCRLRAMEPDDVEMLYVWENDPEIWRVGATTAPMSRQRLARFIAEQDYDIFATRQMRLIIDVDGRAIGAVDIMDYDPQHMRFSLGILVYEKSDRCKGYAREAIEAIKEYGLKTLNLKQIWVEVDDFNEASIALFESCGFVRCGIRKDWCCFGGVFSDVYEYQVILR